MMIGSGLHDIILRRNDKDESEQRWIVCCVEVAGEKNQLPSWSIEARAHIHAQTHTHTHAHAQTHTHVRCCGLKYIFDKQHFNEPNPWSARYG